MTIADDVKAYLSKPSNRLVQGGIFTAEDFNNITGVINGTLDNFMLFDNAGGKPFTIWTTTPRNIKSGAKNMAPYIYCYKIEGKETIIKSLNR